MPGTWSHADPSLQKRDFHWIETDEPHATRRKEILQKYPQVKTLFTKEPRTALIVAFIFVSQMAVAYWVRSQSWAILFFLAYAYGGTVNHSSQLAVHELSHNLAFDSLLANRITQLVANLPTGLPSSMTFTRYHMEHHQFQGVDGIDTDVPTEWEVRTFTNAFLKLCWVFMQPLFYAFRPMIVKPMSPSGWEAVNWVVQMSFNALVVYFMGWRALIYMISGSLLGLGLHPSAGHFIAEHYEFTKGTETYSYYGPCNMVNLNVGYHMEHHDFPKIPWSNLPRLREIAPEYYNTLPHYDSYLKVFWQYVMDPNVGPFSRIKRRTTGRLEEQKQWEAKNKKKQDEIWTLKEGDKYSE
jgi:sphingolipid delta-4 desaturase